MDGQMRREGNNRGYGGGLGRGVGDYGSSVFIDLLVSDLVILMYFLFFFDLYAFLFTEFKGYNVHPTKNRRGHEPHVTTSAIPPAVMNGHGLYTIA